MSRFIQGTCEVHGQTCFEQFSVIECSDLAGLGPLSPEQTSQLENPTWACINCWRALRRYCTVKDTQTIKIVKASPDIVHSRFVAPFIKFADEFKAEIKALYTYEDWKEEAPHIVVEFEYLPLSTLIINLMKGKQPISFSWNKESRSDLISAKKLRMLLTLAHIWEISEVDISILSGDRVFPITFFTSMPISFKQQKPTHLGRI